MDDVSFSSTSNSFSSSIIVSKIVVNSRFLTEMNRGGATSIVNLVFCDFAISCIGNKMMI